MGVITDFIAFETERFEKLRKARRIRALAAALIDQRKPPIPIAESISIDKVELSDLVLLLERAAAKQLARDYLSPDFVGHGLARIAVDQRADLGYWDPFYAVQLFDMFDQLADRVARSAKQPVIARVCGAMVKQPGDPFETLVGAYKKRDLAIVFARVRAVLERIEVERAHAVDAFFDLMTFLQRAFEPLTPVGRRGKPWTIVRITR